ncbi:MAG: DUF4166 domain-containing protein [Novosphingobium sp.]|uniref:SDR family oxidoreductase n=1 Tax=Novosphingobium sp. TaxID=1874826 RepID=UPI003C7ADFC6
MKILILGGYGVFGGRLAQLLSDVAGLTILIGGRDQDKANRFCETVGGAARCVPITVDRRAVADCLDSERPDLVVDASGPFQQYGQNRYAVIEACIAAQIDYLDFADAADFVFGVSRFDAQARQAGIFVLSGVSSFPVLTAAVLREMAKTMSIERIEGGIAPSPFAGVGLNVIRAVVGYAGGPVHLRRGGVAASGTAIAETARYTIAVPGRLPLRNLLFSLVDVPDLQVIPPEYPELTDIWMGAGPVPEPLHRMLILLARARTFLKLPSLAPLSRLCYLVLNRMKYGEHRGGMYVRLRGRINGLETQRSWHLLAEGDDGPFIPSMAIEALVRKMLAGAPPEPGARPATHSLELADYDRLFAGRTIYTWFRDDGPGQPLYRQILGSAFGALPAPVQALHTGTQARTWRGTAQVSRGRGPLAAQAANQFGFPRTGQNVPVSVTFEPGADGETWRRDFDGEVLVTHQAPGTGRSSGLIVERFGAVAVALALVVDGDRLRLIPRRWSLLGLPMPRFLLPRGESFETVCDGRFAFDVTVDLPLIGRVVGYHGTLEPTDSAQRLDPWPASNP